MVSASEIRRQAQERKRHADAEVERLKRRAEERKRKAERDRMALARAKYDIAYDRHGPFI